MTRTMRRRTLAVVLAATLSAIAFGNTITVLADEEEESAPTFVGVPTDITTVAGLDATFTASADGVPAPDITWETQTDGTSTWTVIDGETSFTLTIDRTDATLDGSSYRAVATNSIGTAVSPPARLTVETDSTESDVVAQPADEEHDGEAPAPAPEPSEPIPEDEPTDTTTSTTTVPEPATPHDSDQPRTEPAATDPDCIISPADPDRGKRPMCEIPVGTINGIEYRPQVALVGEAPAIPGGLVRVSVTGWLPGEEINVRLNDSGYLPGIPSGVIHSVRADDGGAATFEVTLPAAADLAFIEQTYGLQHGYWLRFLGSNPPLSFYRKLTTPPADTPPSFSLHPTDVAVTEGEHTVFTVEVAGHPVPTVTWLHRPPTSEEWLPVADVTGPELAVGPLTVADHGTWYRAVAGNGIGEPVTSEPAMLSVTPPVLPLVVPGTVTLGGNGRIGNPLVVDPGVWSPGSTALTYRWMRGATTITGATSATYTPTITDAGAAIRVVVTGSAPGHTSASVTTNSVTVERVFTNRGQTATATGTFSPGGTVQAGYGRWEPDPATDTTVRVTYQWLRNGAPISGRTGRTSTVVQADVDRLLSVRVTLTKPGYRTEVSVSPSTRVTAVPTDRPDTCVPGPSHPDRGKRPICDAPSGVGGNGVTYRPTVQVEGHLIPGGQVRITGSGWRPNQVGGVNVRLNDASYLPSSTSGLLAGSGMVPDARGDIAGTVTLPPQADFDHLRQLYGAESFWLRFLGTDPAISLHVRLQTPPSRSAPRITAHPESVSVTAGALARFTAAANGYPTPGVRWQNRSPGGTWSNIANATSRTLNIPSASVAMSGTQYRAVFTNSQGRAVTTPAQLTVVASDLPSFTIGTPIITGTARVGSSLGVDPGTWRPTPDRLRYQWLRDGASIGGATSSRYSPVAGDVDRDLAVLVTATRSGYAAATAISSPVTVRPAEPETPPSSRNDAGCITSPASPDRGRRPICNSTGITWEGVVYHATINVSGGPTPGGTVTVSGTGWRPGQQVFFRYNDLNFYGNGAGSVNGDGTLRGSGVRVRPNGAFSASVTLPSRDAVEWAARSYGTSRTWIRALGSAPALSMYQDVRFSDASLREVLATEAEEGSVALATSGPTTPPAPPEPTEDLGAHNRGSLDVQIDVESVAVVVQVPDTRQGAWLHGYMFSSPQSLGWSQADEDAVTVWSLEGARLTEGTHTLVVQDAQGEILGWEPVEIPSELASVTSEADSTDLGATTSPTAERSLDPEETLSAAVVPIGASDDLPLGMAIAVALGLLTASGGGAYWFTRRRSDRSAGDEPATNGSPE